MVGSEQGDVVDLERSLVMLLRYSSTLVLTSDRAVYPVSQLRYDTRNYQKRLVIRRTLHDIP